MKRTKIFSWIFLMVMSIVLVFPSLTAFANGKVYEISVNNEIEKGLVEHLKRGFNEAKSNNAEAIILNMHTPGGFVAAASEIGRLMDSTDIPIIAFINSDALSAGAYIALHADKIYMTPNATMGAAAVIDSAGNTAGEKAESDWLAKMTSAAENSGRDPKFAQAMVRNDFDLPELRAPKGKLLTLTAEDAEKVNYSEGTVASIDALLKTLQLEDSEVVKVEQTFAEKLARFITNPIIVPILLSIASIGLVVELYSPGFGLAGSMGLASLGMFFFGHLIAGFAGYETLIIFVIGLILVIAELFVPGGILGIIGGALIIGSLLFAGESFAHMAYSILIAMIIAGIGMVILMKFFGKKLHMFNRLVLRDATSTEEGYVSNTNRIELIGKVGQSITPLRPSGTVLVGQERLDVVTQGGYMDAGKTVEIVKVEGSRIVVREFIEKGGEGI
ncbi:NfeD family protein [Solibacillus merdavium]|uniref:Nodulation protein NfeD n=2 Tax=Solibacillus TaxID=648800 RepID=A0ABR8XIU7_9BACL|nr:nodulation protein NfeD [Solibacillus merdavium]MBD8031852.1 nodulation protein NfeD [Solibacillus merdavium]